MAIRSNYRGRQYADYSRPKPKLYRKTSERQLDIEAIAEAKRLQEEKLRAEASALATRKAKEAAERPPAPDGQRGDGKFYIAFVKMGQGDCTLMTTPKGQVVMIDCGTNSHDSENENEYLNRIVSIVNRPYFLGVDTTIDILIMSHPDRDHYNMIDRVLLGAYTPTLIYHSGDFAEYGSGKTWADQRIARQFVKRVTANRWSGRGGWSVAGVDVEKWPADAAPEDTIEKRDATGGITIVNEPDCQITILASDMVEDPAKDKDDGTNRASVVTLVEIFGAKLLLCADATTSTERMLVRQHGDRIRGVATLMVGHHGSNRTSSSDAFAKHVSPHSVVISAGEVGHKAHHLPSWTVIRRYERVMAEAGIPPGDKRLTTAWDDSFEPVASVPGETTMPIWITGSHDTQYAQIDRPT